MIQNSDHYMSSLSTQPRFEEIKISMASSLDPSREDGLLPMVAAAAIMGVAFHLAIIRVEFERYILHFISGCVLSFFGLLVLSDQVLDVNLLSAVYTALFIALSFHTSLGLSIGAHRLFFHRCRKFPGPLGSRLSRLYVAYLSSKNVQYFKELEKMHAHYGDFVRTGRSPFHLALLGSSAQ